MPHSARYAALSDPAIHPGFSPGWRRASDALRLRRGVEHLHALGPRAIAELILQVIRERRDLPETLELLDEWRARLSPASVRLAGADRFPPRPLHVVAP